MDYLGIGVRGFCMGAADIVPGVSGGTMAFILGIYDELLDAIHRVDFGFAHRLVTMRWREAFQTVPWRFLLALGLGLATAILSLTHGLHWALESHPALLWAFFFGLILASILVVRKRVARWQAAHVLAAFAAALGAYLLVGLSPSETPHTPLLLFLSGALAVCAMILPGISGAFILVLLGKYRAVLAAVTEFDLVTIALVGLGAVVGLASFARLLRWLLRTNHDLVVATLTGFMAGALRKVWPWKSERHLEDGFVQEINVLPAIWDVEAALALALMGTGFLLVWAIEWAVNRR